MARKTSKNSKKTLWKNFTAGALSGACLGIGSTLIVVEFTLKSLPQPLTLALLSAALDLVLLTAGIVGFTLARRVAK